MGHIKIFMNFSQIACIYPIFVVPLHVNCAIMDQYIVSARKYRPTTFESVVGQEALTQTLRNAIRSNHLAHAYLFCGPRGVGKTTCARIFAKTINCLSPTEDHESCNACESCNAFNEQRSYNIHELDAASNNSVEDIRSLIDQVRIPPQVGRYSVYIIDEVHMLSASAFNALLKTLEEPPSYAVFILATTEKHKVLATILSRCQVYDFSRITIHDTIRHLQYVAQSEGVEASEEALNVIAQKADGGMRDALSIFDQLVAFCGKSISYEQAIEVLNVLNSAYYFRLVDAMLRSDVSESLLIFDEILQKGFDAGHFVTGFAQHLRDVLVSKDTATLPLLETSDSIRQQYLDQAKRCHALWIFQALDVINTCDINYRTAKNKRLMVEIALVKLCGLKEMSQQTVQSEAKPKIAATPKIVTPTKVSNGSSSSQVMSKVVEVPKVAEMPRIASVPGIDSMPSLGNLGALDGSVDVNTKVEKTLDPAEEVPKRNTPFTLDQLISAWVGQLPKFQKEQRFAAMLTTYEPVMDSDTMFHITVDNPLQKKEFARFGKVLMDAIREQLKNDFVQLRVEVAPANTVHRAYTSQEKYQVLKTANPHLDEMRKKMNLLLE